MVIEGYGESSFETLLPNPPPLLPEVSPRYTGFGDFCLVKPPSTTGAVNTIFCWVNEELIAGRDVKLELGSLKTAVSLRDSTCCCCSTDGAGDSMESTYWGDRPEDDDECDVVPSSLSFSSSSSTLVPGRDPTRISGINICSLYACTHAATLALLGPVDVNVDAIDSSVGADDNDGFVE